MSSLALESQGMLLKIGNGLSSETFATITEIKTFSGPGGSATVIDVSDLSSLAREKRMGLNDEGQLSFTINYIPTNTQHALLRTQRASRELTSFQLIFTDTGNTTWDFEAYVNGFSVSGAVDGVVEAQVTLEISGAITETP
jgi:predicted secreted protein